MNKYSYARGVGLCLLLILAGSLAWAWFGKPFTLDGVSRGFFVGAALAFLFGFNNLRMGSGYVGLNEPSYSKAYYATLEQRKRLMFADMADGNTWTYVLFISGGLSLLLGILMRVVS